MPALRGVPSTVVLVSENFSLLCLQKRDSL
jgi:hypothetical protein